MNTITELQLPAFDYGAPASPRENSTTATVAQSSTTTRLSASIQTVEGDRVTLTLSSDTRSGQIELPGVRAAARSEESRVSLAVDGELSRTEMKHVEKAFHTFQKVTKDVLYGLVVSAVAHVRQIEKLDTLAAVEGTFQSGAALESTTIDLTV